MKSIDGSDELRRCTWWSGVEARYDVARAARGCLLDASHRAEQLVVSGRLVG